MTKRILAIQVLLIALFVLTTHTALASGTKSVVQGSPVTLSWNVTGGSCRPDTTYPVGTDGVYATWKSATRTSSGSVLLGNATQVGTFTFTCDATQNCSPASTCDSATLVVSAAPANTCTNGATNYPTCTTCTPPQTLVNNVCTSPATKAATGALSLSPTSCVIAAGASTCSTVYATWTTAHTTAPALVDGNVGTTLSTQANQSSPGLQVWVAYPQTVFNLKDGGTLLDTKTATASCATGSSWDTTSSKCAPNPCVATTDNNCDLPATASGSSAGSCSAGSTGTCSYACNSGTWTKTTNLCIPPLSVSCVGTPGNPYINQPVTWTSTVTGGTGPYTYVWSDPNNPSFIDTNSSTQTTYTTTGPEAMSLQVTDARNKTATATCTAGANQPNGPGGTGGGSGGTGSGGIGGSGVSVGSCTASLTASPTTVDQGGSTSVSWSVSGGSLCASSCTGSGFDTGSKTSGVATASVPASPPVSSYTYSLTCSGGTYSSPSSPAPVNTTVTVVSPTAFITVNGQTGTARVNQGTDVTVAWWTDPQSHMTSCTGTNFSTGPLKAVSGSVVQTASTQTTYTVACTNRYGASATASATVNIRPVFNQF